MDYFHEFLVRNQVAHEDEILSQLRRLRTLKGKKELTNNIFRLTSENGENTMKGEGQKDEEIYSLYYEPIANYTDCNLRLYCIIPTEFKNILNVGGGCFKTGGGALQLYAECNSENSKVRSFYRLLTAAIKSKDIYQDGFALISKTPHINIS